MADIKLTELNPATALSEDDITHVVQGLEDRKATIEQVKRVASTPDNVFTASGTPSTIVLTPTGDTVIPNSYFDGYTIEFVAVWTNAGATTVDVGGLGLRNITYKGLPTPVSTLKAGRVVKLRYNATIPRFELLYSDTLVAESEGIVEPNKSVVTDASKSVQGFNSISSASFVQGGSDVVDLSRIAVETGTVNDNDTLPLPPGFSEAQCKWIISWRGTINDTNQGLDGIECYTYNDGITNRKVRSRSKHEANGSWFNVQANYLIIGIK